MLAIFIGINSVFDQTVSTTTTTTPIVVGGLPLDTTNSSLANYCDFSHIIPSNIRSGLFLPAKSSPAAGASIPNSGAGDFDCVQPERTQGATSADILSFYAAHLEAKGWSLFSQGASNGDPQSLFQLAGSDSFYWVIGITVHHVQHGSVTWTFRVYQNSETI
jgi:hypothetical protein